MSATTLAHLLLVEDDPINQIVIKQILVILGYSVEVVGSGNDALAHLIDKNAHFDAVLMDVGLPDLSGTEVTKQLRQTPCPLQNVPIIALTGHVQPKDKQACFDSGMNGFIPKPTTKEILGEELGKILGR